MKKSCVVNHRDQDGRTPLSHACQRGDLEAVKTLVRSNADPEVVDVWGNTALMYAVAEGHSPVVEFLVRAFKRLGVQLDRHNKAGNSAVEVAQILGHTECLTALTRFGRTRRGATEEPKRKLLLNRLPQTSGRPGSRQTRLPSMESIEEGDTEGSRGPGLCRVLHPESKTAHTRNPPEDMLPPLVQHKSFFSPRPNRTPAAPSTLGVTLTPFPCKDPRAVKSRMGDLGRLNDTYHQKRISLPTCPSHPGGTLVLKPPTPADPLRSHRTFSVFGAKLLRRFTAPDIKNDVTAFNQDPVSPRVRIPRSETFPTCANHPQVDSKVSVDSISSVKCEFDFHLSKTNCS